MATITEFDKATVEKCFNEVQAAMRSIAESYGLNVKTNAKYSGLEIKFTSVVSVPSTNPEISGRSAKEENAFKSYAAAYGLDVNLLNTPFKSRKGETVIVTGLNTRSPKYPILFTVNGEPRKAAPTYIKNVLLPQGETA